MAERTVDMVIEGGTIVSPESSVEASIAVDGGVIVAVGAAPTMPKARETVDASGMHGVSSTDQLQGRHLGGNRLGGAF